MKTFKLRANVNVHQTNSGKSLKFVFSPTLIFCSPICPDNCGVVFCEDKAISYLHLATLSSVASQATLDKLSTFGKLRLTRLANVDSLSSVSQATLDNVCNGR